jgi:hypothetical protein
MALKYPTCHALHTGMWRTQFCHSRNNCHYENERLFRVRTPWSHAYGMAENQSRWLEKCIPQPRKRSVIRTINDVQDWQKPYIQIFTILFCSHWSGLHSSMAFLPRSAKYCTPILCILEFLYSFQRHISRTEICTLIWYYAAYSCNSLPTFRDNLSVPSSRVKKSGTIRCVISHMSAELIYIAADGWNRTLFDINTNVPPLTQDDPHSVRTVP